MDEVNKIKLKYLENEWDILDAMAQQKGAHNFRSHLNNRISLMAKNFTIPEIEDNRAIIKAINFIIPPEICIQLTHFARHRKIKLGSLIRWYVGDPLLKEHYEREFKRRRQ